MAQDSVAGKFGKCDLRNQLGLGPVSTLSIGSRNLDRRLVGRERFHPLHQILDQPRVEAGSDLADVGELALFLCGEKQRAKTDPLVALRPANDHEFLSLDALDLEPVASADALVGAARLLRDDTLAALLAHFAEQVLAAPDHMVAVDDRRVDSGKERSEAVLAHDVGQPLDVLAAIDEQVEGIEDEVGASLLLERRLEQLE